MELGKQLAVILQDELTSLFFTLDRILVIRAN